MSFKGCMYSKSGIMSSILRTQNIRLPTSFINTQSRRYKSRSAKRLQQCLFISNDHAPKTTLLISKKITKSYQRHITTSPNLPTSSTFNATVPKYSKDTLDLTTYDHYFHDFRCYPNFSRYILLYIALFFYRVNMMNA